MLPMWCVLSALPSTTWLISLEMADKAGFEPACPKTLALKASALDLTLLLIRMADGAGFEPANPKVIRFLDGRFRPLCYPSVWRTKSDLNRRSLSTLQISSLVLYHAEPFVR